MRNLQENNCLQNHKIMKYLIKFLDVYLIGIFKVSDWVDRHAGDTSKAIFWGTGFLTLFLISIIDSYLLFTNQYAYYVIEGGYDLFWFFGIIILLDLSLSFYVNKYRGKNTLLDGKLNLKEKFICLILVCVFVGNFIRVGYDVRAYKSEYKVQTGWYESHPSKYQGRSSLEEDIRNWFKEKFGDKENK